jgi:hypothetical protein
MEKHLLMTPRDMLYSAFFSLLALPLIAFIAREAVSGLRAGPVRFRLGIASWPQRGPRIARKAANVGFPVAVISALLVVVSETIFTPLEPLLVPILLLCGRPSIMSGSLPQRDEKRWLVFASGLLLLVAGALLLLAGLRMLHFADISVRVWPRALQIVYSFILFVLGAVAIQESMSGTRVRERGIEMLGTTQPWPRIVVNDWHPRGGDFDLSLTVLSPRLFGMRVTPDSEAIVPVPASERPALEIFLAGHIATAE